MNKKKIFIVEDQVITSMTLSDNLEALGYEVIGVKKSAEEAIEFLEKNTPDLILMDIYLKGEMTGLEATEIIYSKFQLPVIFITASTNDKVFEKAKVEGVFGFIIKPFDIKEIRISIEIALFKHDIEQKVKKDKYFLNEAQRIANVGHWDLNIRTGELKWSDETYRIFEVAQEEFPATYDAFLAIVHPDDKEFVKSSYNESVINKTNYTIEHRLLFPDGRIKYVKESCETFYDIEDNPTYSLGTVQDITSNKIAELALKQSEQNFKELYFNSIDEVYLADYNTLKIISANSTALKELGYTEKELQSKTVFDLTNQPNNISKAKTKLAHLELNQTLNYRTFHVRKNQTIYPIDLKVKKIKYSGKDVLLGLAQNITEKVKIEKQKEDDRQVRSVLNQMLSLTLEDKSLKCFIDEALALVLTLPYFKNLSKAAIFTKKDENTLELISHVNFEQELINRCSLVKKGFCMCGLTFAKKEIQYACCNENQYKVDVIANQDIGNYNIPILNKGNVMGVLSIYLEKHHKKDDNELDVLKTIANTLGIILMRKTNQEALLRSENRFRELAETIKEIFWLVDCKTQKLIYVSPAYEDIYEQSIDSLYKDGAVWEQMVHPDDKENVLNAYGFVKESGVDIEFRLLMPDGRIKWLHDTTFPITENGEVVRMAGRSVDITQRKLAENELVVSEEKFRTYVENSADVISILDENKKIVFNSSNNKLIFGYDSNQNMGKSIEEFLHPEEVIHYNDLFNKIIKNENVGKSFEYRFKHQSGEWIWVESTVKYINEENNASYFIVNSRDVSERKKIENNLKESEFRYRSLFENSLSGIYRISLDCKIIESNDAFANIIGYKTGKEIKGKNVYELFDREEDFIEKLNQNNGKLISHENFILLKRNNKRVRLLENIVEVKSKDGKPRYFEGSVIDTTFLLEVEKEKRAFEIIPAEHPNAVIRVDYSLKVLYNNEAGEEIVNEIAYDSVIRNKKVVDFIDDVLINKVKKKEIEIKIKDKYYLLFLSNIYQHEYINIYAANITELKNTQADYLKLSLDLEQLVEQRTNELNSTVDRLNKEIKEKLTIEEQIKKSLKEKEVLLNEITHRVKNNLQVVSSLLSLQKDTIENKDSIQLLTETGNRIKSMALIHETLYKTNNFSQINFKNYIDSLVYYISNSYDTSYIKIQCDIEEVELTIDTATSCGMIVMELITNSLKYAFKEKQKGIIELKLTKTNVPHTYLLVIADDGEGFPEDVDFSSTKTLGMQLVLGLSAQLQGIINKKTTKGTCFEITFKDTKRHKYEEN